MKFRYFILPNEALCLLIRLQDNKWHPFCEVYSARYTSKQNNYITDAFLILILREMNLFPTEETLIKGTNITLY